MWSRREYPNKGLALPKISGVNQEPQTSFTLLSCRVQDGFDGGDGGCSVGVLPRPSCCCLLPVTRREVAAHLVKCPPCFQISTRILGIYPTEVLIVSGWWWWWRWSFVAAEGSKREAQTRRRGGWERSAAPDWR